MADVFISYASEDRDRARSLASVLESRGWSVWWDRKIVAGQTFDQAIEHELETAKSVVVLWSRNSISSEWVKNEAAAAAERGTLVPAMIDIIKLPLEFRRKQTADIVNWNGDLSHEGFQKLCEAVATKADLPPPPHPSPSPPKSAFQWKRQWTLGAIVVTAVLVTAVMLGVGDYWGWKITRPTLELDEHREQTRISVAEFAERFSHNLRQYNYPSNPVIKKVTPMEFTAASAQNIIDGLPEKSILYLHKGVYYLEDISINKPMVLLGEDALATKLVFSKWSLSMGENTSRDAPAWIVNTSVLYTGNDALMYAINTTGYSIISYCRVEATSPFSPWLVQASGALSMDNNVLLIRPNNSAGLSVFSSDKTLQTSINAYKNNFIAHGGTTYFALPDSSHNFDIVLEGNIFYSQKDKDGDSPKFIGMKDGSPKPFDFNKPFHFNKNVFVGLQSKELLDLQLGRQDDKTIYADDIHFDENYYLAPDSPFFPTHGSARIRAIFQ